MNLTDSQFKTFRADGRNEVRKIATEIENGIAEACRVPLADLHKKWRQVPDSVKVTQPSPKDGDVYFIRGEKFTYFWGQWRRPSEMTSYPSAAKYL